MRIDTYWVKHAVENVKVERLLVVAIYLEEIVGVNEGYVRTSRTAEAECNLYSVMVGQNH